MHAAVKKGALEEVRLFIANEGRKVRSMRAAPLVRPVI